jgi:hypothetical protein
LATVCERIFARDRRIGFAMVVDPKGRIIESKIRGPTLMPEDDIALFAGLWTSIIGGVGKQLEKYFGRYDFNSLGYEKLNVHGVTVGDNTIVITATKDLPLQTVLSLREITQD